jgi:hypothetical protein
VIMYQFSNLDRAAIWQGGFSATIAVPVFTYPPNAPQYGTTVTIDTSDARFVNASTQVGNSLFQTHSISAAPFSIPKWYEFNTGAATVTQSGYFWATLSSFDFNVSIAANDNKDVFVTWTSIDPANSTNAQVWYGGRQSSDGAGVMNKGAALFTSPIFYAYSGDNPERWGDYSAVSIDPLDNTKAWIVNETILKYNDWGTFIAKIGY